MLMHAGPGGTTRVLHPGDVGCGERGDRFETLLGSCVAVVLTDPRRSVGTMCHIVHSAPTPPGRPADTAHAHAALARMRDLLWIHGLHPALCDAYVHGGGNMFPHLVEGDTVGDRNVDEVLRLLDEMGVRVLGLDVGGTAYRRLEWTVGPGAPTVDAVSVETGDFLAAPAAPRPPVRGTLFKG